jgi:hypothetical protein
MRRFLVASFTVIAASGCNARPTTPYAIDETPSTSELGVALDPGGGDPGSDTWIEDRARPNVDDPGGGLFGLVFGIIGQMCTDSVSSPMIPSDPSTPCKSWSEPAGQQGEQADHSTGESRASSAVDAHEDERRNGETCDDCNRVTDHDPPLHSTRGLVPRLANGHPPQAQEAGKRPRERRNNPVPTVGRELVPVHHVQHEVTDQQDDAESSRVP